MLQRPNNDAHPQFLADLDGSLSLIAPVGGVEFTLIERTLPRIISFQVRQQLRMHLSRHFVTVRLSSCLFKWLSGFACRQAQSLCEVWQQCVPGCCSIQWHGPPDKTWVVWAA